MGVPPPPPPGEMNLKLWCISLFCLLKLSFLQLPCWLSKTPNNYFTVWFCSTVESQFFKPPWERQIYSNDQKAWNIGHKITMFHHWREVTLCLFELLVISKHQWFKKSGFYFICWGFILQTFNATVLWFFKSKLVAKWLYTCSAVI